MLITPSKWAITEEMSCSVSPAWRHGAENFLGSLNLNEIILPDITFIFIFYIASRAIGDVLHTLVYSLLLLVQTPQEPQGIEMGPRASSAWRGVRRLCGMHKFTTNPSCGWDVNKTEVPCWEIATLSAR